MLYWFLTTEEKLQLNKKHRQNKVLAQKLDAKRVAMSSQTAKPQKVRSGYQLTTWHYRRSLKIAGPTLDAEAVSRCYQNISTRMYQRNVEASRCHWEWPGLEVNFINSANLEPQIWEKHVAKKTMRGAQPVRRRKVPTSRTYAWKSIWASEKQGSRQEFQHSDRNSIRSLGEIEMTQQEPRAPRSLEPPSHDFQKMELTPDALDEDEWVDVYNDEDFDVERNNPPLVVVEDEYILL